MPLPSFRIRFHPRARRIKLKIHRDASLEVVAPPGISERSVRNFVQTHRDWVEKTRARVRADRCGGPEAGPFPSRLALRALDQVAPVNYVDADRPAWCWNAQDVTIGLPARRPELAHPALVGAIKQRAADRLAPRFHALAERHGRVHGRLTWRNQKTRWGSCSSNGNISLNVRLLFLPPQLVDYVFAHELAHLDHPDHSPRFWNALEAMLPGARTHRGAIRNADHLLPDWIVR